MGIKLLQGLDFVTFWMPALFAFLVGVPSREPWTAVFSGWEHETAFFLSAVVYTGLQVLTALLQGPVSPRNILIHSRRKFFGSFSVRA